MWIKVSPFPWDPEESRLIATLNSSSDSGGKMGWGYKMVYGGFPEVRQ